MHSATADLNALYFRHQIALIHASEALGRTSKNRHQARADALAGRIGQIQRRAGATANVAWSTRPAQSTEAAQ